MSPDARAGGDPPAGDDAIVGAHIWQASVPLDRPLRLGAQVMSAREYVALELTTSSGLRGFAVGLTRGLPLAAMLDGIAGEVIGGDATRRHALLASIVARHRNAALSLTRPLALVEIALWDLLCKRSGLPLWRLLGGHSPSVPVVAVGGYFADQRPRADVADELRRLADEGFGRLKVHAEDPAVVQELRRALPTGVELAVDLGMAMPDLGAALACCRALDDLGLWFIEDPFPPERVGLTAELAGAVRTPIAAGEDANGPEMLAAIAGAADVLRVDATASGGIDAVLRATAHAALRGIPVITHAVVELHAQLAGGVPGIGFAETIPYASGANPLDLLLSSVQRIDGGRIALSERPGVGLELDADALAAFTSWSSDHEA